MENDPIVVSSNPLVAQSMSLFRDFLVAGSVWLVANGYVDTVTGDNLVLIGTGVATVIWRQLVTYRTHRKLVVTADAAPSSIARVK